MEDTHNLSTSAEKLRISEIRYRRLFETARDGILILDAVTRKITDVNPFMIELLGYTHDDFLGKELWEIGLLKDEDENIRAFEELQKNGYIRYDDLPLKSKDGECWEVEFVSNLYSENNRQVVQCNIRDITELKLVEQTARKAEFIFRNMVESSPGIVYLNEPNPPYSAIYMCPNIKLYGYTPEDWYADPNMWLSIVHREDSKRVMREVEIAARHGSETELEYRIVGRDGSVHWWQDKRRFILDAQGKRTGWQGIILDTTATKELEQRLYQAHKLESVGLLAGGIAHDFNNMLTVINGYSDLALRRLEENDPLRHHVEEIKKAGLRSAALTHQLLAFSRRQVLKPSVTDLNEVINETIKMLHRLIGEDIQLTTTLNHQIGRVMVDPGQFSQIIMNLAVNARDAMPKGGKLTIETANVFLEPSYTQQHTGVLPGAYVLLAVSDTGTGMSDDIKQHIFDPFYTTKELGHGTGLGLATVYGIVKQSGGNIEVYSEEEIGTTFKIYLPRVTEQIDVHRIKNIPITMSSGAETILLVEDEPMVRELSKEILTECGYTIIEAGNGIEALLACGDDCQIDLLMTDVVMPKMGGRELAETLMQRLPNLKILFTSGYTDDAVVRHGVIETNTNFIQKPFTPEALATKIRWILDNPSES